MDIFQFCANGRRNIPGFSHAEPLQNLCEARFRGRGDRQRRFGVRVSYGQGDSAKKQAAVIELVAEIAIVDSYNFV